MHPTHPHTVLPVIIGVFLDWSDSGISFSVITRHCGNNMATPLPAKHPWRLRVNTTFERTKDYHHYQFTKAKYMSIFKGYAIYFFHRNWQHSVDIANSCPQRVLLPASQTYPPWMMPYDRRTLHMSRRLCSICHKICPPLAVQYFGLVIY